MKSPAPKPVPQGAAMEWIGEKQIGKMSRGGTRYSKKVKRTTFPGIRLHFPSATQGVSIDVGGYPLKSLDPAWLRSKNAGLALVSQEPTLFATTIRDNLCYGGTFTAFWSSMRPPLEPCLRNGDARRKSVRGMMIQTTKATLSGRRAARR